MIKLKEIASQAFSCDKTMKSERNGYSTATYLGVKLIQDHKTKEVEILSVHNDISYEENLEKKYINEILEKGWTKGVINIYLWRLSNEKNEKI